MAEHTPFPIWEAPADDTVEWVEQLPALQVWLRAHGVDPGKITRRFVVCTHGDRKRFIHASEYLTDERGNRYVGDHATGLAATKPLIVPMRTPPPGCVRASVCR